MKRAVIVISATVLVFAAVVLVGGGISDDSKSSDEAIRDVQRQYVGAEGCMPPDVRRRWIRLRDRYNARYAYVIDRLPSDADHETETRALRSDAKLVRTAEEVRSLLTTYSPGGSGYEKDCYDRAIELFERSNPTSGAGLRAGKPAG